MNVPWSAAVAPLLLLAACTEPNPYLPMSKPSDESSTSGSDGSGVSTSRSSSSGGGLDGSSSGVAPSECAAAGMQCIEMAPEGWSGPFAWMERPTDLEPVPCPAPWQEQWVEAFSDISAPSARCSCSCGPLVGASCGPASVQHYANTDCTGAVLDAIDLDTPCELLSLGEGSWSAGGGYAFDASNIVGGGCFPLPQLELEDASFLNRHRACGAALESLDCEAGQLCAALPTDPLLPRWCVWQEGDVQCPEGASYIERERLYRSIEDQRGCAPCTCAAPTDTCIGTSLGLSVQPLCELILGGVQPDGCSPGPAVIIQSLQYVPGAAEGECEPTVVVPTGDASGTEPVTFCCTP